MEDNQVTHKVDSLVGSFYNQQSYQFQQEESGTTLSFGTVGVRGQFGLGSGCLNQYTTQHLALGVVYYLQDSMAQPSIVTHYDIRHLPAEFADIIAHILASHHIEIYVSDTCQTTPQLSYAMRYLQMSTGIMITASHNPKDYNGIKVYGADGAQLDDVASLEVAKYIEQLDNPLYLDIELNETLVKGNILPLPEDINQYYSAEINQLIGDIPLSNLNVVHTSLHGTETPIIPKVLSHLHSSKIEPADAQCKVDPDLSSVKGANPEEHEAFGLAIKQVQYPKTGLIIATDPDMDRMGFVKRDHDGHIHRFNDSEIGALMIKCLVDCRTPPKQPVMIQLIVSGGLEKCFVKQHGVTVREALIGFKFIAKVIRELREDEIFTFAYEESYGYLAGEFARDKDATRVVPLVIKYASVLKDEGKMLHDTSMSIYKEVGHYRDQPTSKVFEGRKGQQEITTLMEHPCQHIPDMLGGLKVIAVEDYQSQERINKDDGTTESIALPKSSVIRSVFDKGSVALCSPGTEPRLRFYLSLNVDDFEQVSHDIYQYIFNDSKQKQRNKCKGITSRIESLYSQHKMYFN